MKNLNLIVWLTQLGISVAAPLAGFTLLALWLQQRYALGKWVVLVGLFLGLWSAISGFCTSLRTMRKLSDGKKDKEEHDVVVDTNKFTIEDVPSYHSFCKCKVTYKKEKVVSN